MKTFCWTALILLSINLAIAQNFVGSSPDIEMLNPGKVSGSSRSTFSAWSMTAQTGVAQNFLSLSSNAILSSSGELSPLFSINVFQDKKGFGFQSGVGYTTHRYSVETVSATQQSLRLSYLNVPVMARYTLSPAFSLSAGLAVAFNVSAKSDFDFETGRAEPDGVKTKHETVKNSINNVRICTAYTFPFGLTIQGTYTRSLGEILKDGSDGKTFGFVDLQVGYVIFGTHYRATDRLRPAGPKNGW
jgi:hypothetical protein